MIHELKLFRNKLIACIAYYKEDYDRYSKIGQEDPDYRRAYTQSLISLAKVDAYSTTLKDVEDLLKNEL